MPSILPTNEEFVLTCILNTREGASADCCRPITTRVRDDDPVVPGNEELTSSSDGWDE